MSLISHSIANLFNGVSQQSPSIRQPAQAELQENCFSSIVDGLHKRHPTSFLAKLAATAPTGNPFIHVINRDSYEKYVMIINGGAIQVWDLDGNPKTVTIENGGSYINANSPAEDLTALTIADVTFIVNRKVVARRPSGNSVGTATFTFSTVYLDEYLNPQGAYYRLKINGVTYDKTCTNGAAASTYASYYQGLLAGILGANYTVTASGATLTISANNSSTVLGAEGTFFMYWYDRWDGDYQGWEGWEEDAGYLTVTASSTLAMTTVSEYNDLPATGTAGVTYKITGDSSNAWAAYYCKWDGASYVETVGTPVSNEFDPSTMPHQLVRNANGTFTLKRITWNKRLVGDETSNSPPSFTDTTIQDMFFFRNRMGFLSGENVIFSRAGDFFNFWVETATQVLDTDPIDVSVSHVKVSNLKHAIPFNKNLLLFSELTQFVLTASDTLTPKTVAIHATTEFECSKKARPTVVGSNVYFAVDKGAYSAIREYYVSPYTSTYDADDVTAHAPKYVPGGVQRLVSTSNDDLVFALSPRDPNALYVYKFYWKGEEKLQSSWSRWVFKDNCQILNMEMMGTKLYLVIKKPDGLYLEYIDLQVALVEDDLDFLVCLDRKVKRTGTFNSTTGYTTWTLPYAETGVQVVLSGEFTGKKGALLTTSQDSTTTVKAFGDFSGGAAFIGVPYTMRYQFSPQYMRDKQNVSIAGATLKLRNFRVFYNKSGYFRAEVTPQQRETQTHPFTGKKLGIGSTLLGQVNISSGVFQFPVFTDGVTGVIQLVNDSYLPCFFQSAEWEGFAVSRASRM